MDRDAASLLCRLARGPTSTAELAKSAAMDRGRLERVLDLLEARALVERRGNGRVALHPGLDYDATGLRRTIDSRYRVSFNDRVASTNALAREATPPPPPRRGLVVAREQTGGRGRYDRAWASPPGGIWASILDARSRPSRAAWRDQLAMAVAVTDVTAVLGLSTRLKWPNDVVTGDGRKLAGVLLEGTIAGGTVDRTVCGVGLNADVDPADLPQGATSLSESLGPLAPVGILPFLITAFEHRQRQPEATAAAWRERSHTLGRAVVLTADETTIEGTAVGLDADGALEVETAGERHRIPPERCRRLRYRDG